MTDRELIERAARAAGITGEYLDGLGFIPIDANGARGAWWNPLEEDGDALRLMVTCQLDVFVRAGRWTEAVAPMGAPAKVLHDGDALAATRRAITMAAAQIKKAQA